MNSALATKMLHIGMLGDAIETIHVGQLTVLRALPREPVHPPVLFVHGYFADATVFTEWLPLFASRGFPAYAVNLRGRAESISHTNLGATSIHDFVDDAAMVANSLESRVPPLVIGHSMGGLIAQMLAARGDVRAAILMTPAPPRGITVLSVRLALKQLKYLSAILASRTVTPSREDMRKLVFNR
ncbi:MAG TPA: alpha/beta fold hydrolase, partial [Gemmatimonadaceae bacterium]|nr:alpha/beta fold hydrolase [Gemmatimonadaceae bacterium]